MGQMVFYQWENGAVWKFFVILWRLSYCRVSNETSHVVDYGRGPAAAAAAGLCVGAGAGGGASDQFADGAHPDAGRRGGDEQVNLQVGEHDDCGRRGQYDL